MSFRSYALAMLRLTASKLCVQQAQGLIHIAFGNVHRWR